MDDFRSRLASLEPNRSREARPAAIEPFGIELTQQSNESKQEGIANFYHVAIIKFREAGQTYDADALDRRYVRGERVLVETQKGLALAFIAQNSERKFSSHPTIKVLRRIEDTDLRQVERNAEKEEEAFRFCIERIKARDLSMKLIRTEVLHGGNKAIFYFSAEGRIDFRELVKDLAHKFHLRIEMRQVGVRDEAKLMGGVGACGRELCCSTWLKDFAPVSLKMARDQNLALNPQKVSGVCGRLMCCLSYEEDSYRELRRGLPRLGRRVITPKGEGEVRELDVLRQRVRVSFDEFQEIFPVSEIKYAAEGATEEEGSIEPSPERGRESRDERKERGRRMLERRGIIGSGEASAAASMGAADATPEAAGATPTAETPQGEARIQPSPRPERRDARDERRPRDDNRGPQGRDERRGPPRDDNRGPQTDRGPQSDRGPRRDDDNRGRDSRNQQDPRRRDDNRGPQNDRPREDNRGPQNERRDDRAPQTDRGPRDNNQGPQNERGAPRDDRGPRREDDNRGNTRDDNRNRPDLRTRRDDSRGPQNERGPRDENQRSPRDDNRGNTRDDNRGAPRDDRGPQSDRGPQNERGPQGERPRDDNRGPQNDRGPRRDDRRPERGAPRNDRGPRDENRGAPREENRGPQNERPRDDNQHNDNRGNQRDDSPRNERPQDDRRGPPRPRTDPPKEDKE